MSKTTTSRYVLATRDTLIDKIEKLEAEIVEFRAKNEWQPIPQDIRDEMDADMEDSGVAQGEIESCLLHWSNKNR